MITRPRRCGRDHYYYASCVTPGPCVYASTVYARPHGYWPTGAEREGGRTSEVAAAKCTRGREEEGDGVAGATVTAMFCNLN